MTFLKRCIVKEKNSKVEYPFFPFHRLSETQQGKSYAIADLLRGNLPQPQQEQEPIAKNNTITSIPKPIQLPTDWDSITAKQLCELPTNQESKAFPTWEEPKLNTPKQYQEPVYNDWSQIPFPRTKNNSQ